MLKIMFLALILLSTSGCEMAMGSNSYLNASQKPASTCGYQDYRCMARVDAVQAGINPDLFERQINMESGFNPYALSYAGAEGIAQFEPSTAGPMGIDPWNPTQALQGAAQLMSRYYKNYGYNYRKALAAYQCGSGCVDTAVYWYGWNWEQHVPSSTVTYIRVITGA